MFLFLQSPGLAQTAACPVKDFDAWLDLISDGQFESAASQLAQWQKAPGCVCTSPQDACLEIAPEGNEKRAVSAAQLDKVVSEALAWTSETRKRCVPLSGSDAVGIAAWQACVDRQAETLAGITDPLSRQLLAEPLKKAAGRMAKKSVEEAGGDRVIPMTAPSPFSPIIERSAARAKKLALEICEMRRGLMDVETRLANMKRQPKVMRGEYNARLRTQEKLRDDLNLAIDRSTAEFKQNAGRDFDAGRDCFQQDTDKPKPAE